MPLRAATLRVPTLRVPTLCVITLCVISLLLGAPLLRAQQPVIIDTDIGDDIDDAYAVSLMLASPEVKILGITSAWGDTQLRARMIDRLLCTTGQSGTHGHAGIPVLAGVPTRSTTPFSQSPWAAAGLPRPHPPGEAVPFLLRQIRQHPGQITLLALGPLTNLAAAIDRDPATFRQLRRVVLMGGSLYRGYGAPGTKAEPEYNLYSDPHAAQKLLASGVPLFFLPLDSTQIPFDASRQAQFAAISTPLTDTLLVLTAEWKGATTHTPTLFDSVAAAYLLDPATCPMTPLQLTIDDKGATIPGSLPLGGRTNANACLTPHPELFFPLMMPRLTQQHLTGAAVCTAQPKP